jgi:uncharacterized protein YutE (UPF0331/DUF86 family)
MRTDQQKIRQKIHFMRENIKLLEQFKEMDQDQFTSDPITESAALRMLQVSIEAMLDICSHIIAREGWGLAKTYVEIVELTVKHGLIPKEKADIYKNMARFRNRIIHLYDRVDSAEVLNIINNHLDDFGPFLSAVIERYLP